jgi:hypothetical protein
MSKNRDFWKDHDSERSDNMVYYESVEDIDEMTVSANKFDNDFVEDASLFLIAKSHPIDKWRESYISRVIGMDDRLDDVGEKQIQQGYNQAPPVGIEYCLSNGVVETTGVDYIDGVECPFIIYSKDSKEIKVYEVMGPKEHLSLVIDGPLNVENKIYDFFFGEPKEFEKEKVEFNIQQVSNKLGIVNKDEELSESFDIFQDSVMRNRPWKVNDFVSMDFDAMELSYKNRKIRRSLGYFRDVNSKVSTQVYSRLQSSNTYLTMRLLRGCNVNVVNFGPTNDVELNKNIAEFNYPRGPNVEALFWNSIETIEYNGQKFSYTAFEDSYYSSFTNGILSRVKNNKTVFTIIPIKKRVFSLLKLINSIGYSVHFFEPAYLHEPFVYVFMVPKGSKCVDIDKYYLSQLSRVYLVENFVRMPSWALGLRVKRYTRTREKNFSYSLINLRHGIQDKPSSILRKDNTTVGFGKVIEFIRGKSSFTFSYFYKKLSYCYDKVKLSRILEFLVRTNYLRYLKFKDGYIYSKTSRFNLIYAHRKEVNSGSS